MLELGTCKRPHGIKGGFSFALYNTKDSILKKGSLITLFPLDNSSSIPPKGKRFKIYSIGFGKKVIGYLEGVVNRDQVEKMIPFSIQVARSSLPKVSQDEYYLEELKGIEVFEQGTGSRIGEVVSFYHNGAQTVVVIKGVKVFELPLVDIFFPLIDIENRRVEIILPQEI